MNRLERVAVFLACCLLCLVAWVEGRAQGERAVMREALRRGHAVKWYAGPYSDPEIVWSDDPRVKGSPAKP